MAITESIREKPRIRELEPKRRADTFRGLVCDDVSSMPGGAKTSPRSSEPTDARIHDRPDRRESCARRRTGQSVAGRPRNSRLASPLSSLPARAAPMRSPTVPYRVGATGSDSFESVVLMWKSGQASASSGGSYIGAAVTGMSAIPMPLATHGSEIQSVVETKVWPLATRMRSLTSDQASANGSPMPSNNQRSEVADSFVSAMT